MLQAELRVWLQGKLGSGPGSSLSEGSDLNLENQIGIARWTKMEIDEKLYSNGKFANFLSRRRASTTYTPYSLCSWARIQWGRRSCWGDHISAPTFAHLWDEGVQDHYRTRYWVSQIVLSMNKEREREREWQRKRDKDRDRVIEKVNKCRITIEQDSSLHEWCVF